MESIWQKTDENKEQKISKILSQNGLVELLGYLINFEKDILKNKLEKLPKGDFYKEAMDMNVAKGGCVALEQFKLKLISYVGKE